MITWWELFLMAMALGFAHFCRIQTTIQIKKAENNPIQFKFFLRIFRKALGNLSPSYLKSSNLKKRCWLCHMMSVLCPGRAGRAEPPSLSEGPFHSQMSERTLLFVWVPQLWIFLGVFLYREYSSLLLCEAGSLAQQPPAPSLLSWLQCFWQ